MNIPRSVTFVRLSLVATRANAAEDGGHRDPHHGEHNQGEATRPAGGASRGRTEGQQAMNPAPPRGGQCQGGGGTAFTTHIGG